MAADQEVTLLVKAEVEGEEQVEKFAKMLETLDGETVQAVLALEAAEAQQALTDLLLDLAKMDGTEAEFDIKMAQAGQLKSDLDDLKAKITDIENRRAEVQVEADTSQAERGLENVEADAKALDGLKPQITPEVDSSRARQGIDDLGRSADSSKSVLANMVGNATQDLGALGGIAGSAGVAIGQMGEYMVDARSAGDSLGQTLQNFGKVAGPIALISVAIGAITSVLGSMKAEAEEAEERTKALGEAMESTGNDALGFAEVLRENSDALTDFIAVSNDPLGNFGVQVDELMSKVPLVGPLFKEAGVDIIDTAARAGLSVYDLSQQIENGGEMTEDFAAQLQAAKDAGKITGDEMRAVEEIMNKYGSSAEAAARKLGLFKVDQEEANAMLEQLLAQQAPLEHWTAQWEVLMRDMADGSIDTRDAATNINFLAENLGISEQAVIELAQAEIERRKETKDGTKATKEQRQALREHHKELREDAKAAKEAAAAHAEMRRAIEEAQDVIDGAAISTESMGEALDILNATTSELDFSLMAFNTVESFDTMKAAIKEAEDAGVDWANVDLTPDSIEELKGIPDELVAVTEGMAGMRDSIQTELKAAFDTGGVKGFTDKSKMFAGQIRDQFLPIFTEMTGDSEVAKGMVNQLLDEIGLLPKDRQTTIKLAKAQEALTKLQLLNTFMTTNFPPGKQLEIAMLIEEGKFEEALDVAEGQLDAMERKEWKAHINAIADTTAARGSINAVEQGSYVAGVDLSVSDNAAQRAIDDMDGSTIGINIIPYSTPLQAGTNDAAGGAYLVGEQGPELVVLPQHTQVVPAGATRQALRRTVVAREHRAVSGSSIMAPVVNINLRAGVIGNRFDVARVVTQATTNAIRIAGARTALAGSR